MKAVIQRVNQASVKIENETYSSINKGLFILFCVEKNDSAEKIDFFVNKVLNLRIFNDDNGKMNLSIKDVRGEILVVSQFTLAADCKKGLRPSFDMAMEPKKADEFYENFVSRLRQSGLAVKTGVFGAHMDISLINNGPVTFVLEK